MWLQYENHVAHVSGEGTSVEEDKCECPATIVPFLGIDLDTEVVEICLLADKLQQLRKQVHDCMEREESCHKKGTVNPYQISSACP